MHSTLAIRNSRIALAVALAITLGACATKHETRPSQEPVSTTKAAPKPVHVTKAKPSAEAKGTAATDAAMAKPHMNMLAAPTGIAECDDYLGNYKACHAVLGTPFTNIDTQLAELRTSILDTVSSQGTEAARAKCVALVKQRDDALAGRSCK
jgi:hypothetical protein